MKKLVIIPGGFHPYHAGHKALYDAAREAFPSAEVYVAATDDTTGRPFPFRHKKKLAQMAGIPANRFIQVKSPFSAEEITQHFDPNETQLIFVRSDKDRNQNPQPGQPGQIITRGPRKGLSPYLQPYRRNGLEPMKDHAYITYLPTVQFGPGMTSATEIRAKWPTMSLEQKNSLVSKMYPMADNDAKVAKVVEILDTVMGTGVNEIAPMIGAAIGGAIARSAGAGALGQLGGRVAGAGIASSVNSDVDEAHLNELDLFNKRTDYIKMGNGQFIDIGYRVTDRFGQPGNPLVTNSKIRWVPPQEAVTLKLNDRVTDVSRKMDSDNVFTLDSSLIPPNVKSQIAQWIKTHPAPTTEAVLVNDPDAGHQIIPDGGMGTWDEASMVNNLARKFADMVNMVKGKNYSGLQYALYKGGVVKGLVDALAEYERFMQKQGRRPIARGREIDMSQLNLAEKIRMRMPVDESPDYIEEGDVVPFPASATPPEGYEQAKQMAFKIVDIAKDEKIQDPGSMLAPLRRDLQMLGWRMRMDNSGMRLIHTRSNWNTIIDPMK